MNENINFTQIIFYQENYFMIVYIFNNIEYWADIKIKIKTDYSGQVNNFKLFGYKGLLPN